MDRTSPAIGALVWAVTLGSCVGYLVRLRRAVFATGTVIGLREVMMPGGDGPSWHPIIRYKIGDSKEVEFQAGWGSMHKKWDIGQTVKVKIIDGRLDVHDVYLFLSVIAFGILVGFGMMFTH